MPKKSVKKRSETINPSFDNNLTNRVNSCDDDINFSDKEQRFYRLVSKVLKTRALMIELFEKYKSAKLPQSYVNTLFSSDSLDDLSVGRPFEIICNCYFEGGDIDSAKIEEDGFGYFGVVVNARSELIVFIQHGMVTKLVMEDILSSAIISADILYDVTCQAHKELEQVIATFEDDSSAFDRLKKRATVEEIKALKRLGLL